MVAKITRDVLESYFNCKYKGRLKLAGEAGQKSDCESMVTTIGREMRAQGIEQLLAREGERAGDGGEPTPLALNGHCSVCEFRQRCHAEAVRLDDLSLLRGMGENEIRKQNRKGIFTVTQLSHTFRPRRKGKRAKGQGQPHHHALQ